MGHEHADETSRDLLSPLNSSTATIIPPPGATVDGFNGPIPANQQIPHEVIYPDGHRCIIEPSVSGGYVIADILLWGLVFGVLVDAVTGDWKSLNADACPGVTLG